MKTPAMLFATLLVLAAGLLAQSSSPQDLVKQGEKLSREGQQDQALALYRQAMQASPNLYEAHLGAGAALDLEGQYLQARREFAKAIDLAPPQSKAQAFRAMAISYPYQPEANKAAKNKEQNSKLHLDHRNNTGTAETAD